MGRWVTSNGRRIYIPDEGEENPFAKKSQKSTTDDAKERERMAINIDDRLSPGLGNKWTDEERERDVRNFLKEVDKDPDAWKEHTGTVNRAREYIRRKDQINKDLDDKEKQIAQSKTEADKLNGKNSANEYAKSQGYISVMQMAREVGKNPRALEFANKLMMKEGKSYQEAAALAHAAFMHKRK